VNARLEEGQRALKRMLGNGPLTAMPKRPSDQQLIATLAAAQFDRGREYRESEVNRILEDWLATFCEPYGIDHVTLRRLLVDSRLLSRTTSGGSYRVSSETIADANPDPAAILAAIRAERESRRRQRPRQPPA
jgi:hypothetical protein